MQNKLELDTFFSPIILMRIKKFDTFGKGVRPQRLSNIRGQFVNIFRNYKLYVSL